jgi:predicted PurR-regulated permease PerM
MRFFLNRTVTFCALILMITLVEYLVLKYLNESSHVSKHTDELLKNANKMMNAYHEVIESLQKELELKESKLTQSIQSENDRLGDTYIRDFYHYDCSNVVRYGVDSLDSLSRHDGNQNFLLKIRFL